MLGFNVPNRALAELARVLVHRGGTLLDELKETSQGPRVRMENPDGRLVEVCEINRFTGG